MNAHQPSDHIAGADKMIACSGGVEALPLLNPGDTWELFETADLRRWENVYRRKLAEDQAALRTAAMNHLRSRNTLAAIDRELTRRHQLGGKEA